MYKWFSCLYTCTCSVLQAIVTKYNLHEIILNYKKTARLRQKNLRTKFRLIWKIKRRSFSRTLCIRYLIRSYWHLLIYYAVGQRRFLHFPRCRRLQTIFNFAFASKTFYFQTLLLFRKKQNRKKNVVHVTFYNIMRIKFSR